MEMNMRGASSSPRAHEAQNSPGLGPAPPTFEYRRHLPELPGVYMGAFRKSGRVIFGWLMNSQKLLNRMPPSSSMGGSTSICKTVMARPF